MASCAPRGIRPPLKIEREMIDIVQLMQLRDWNKNVALFVLGNRPQAPERPLRQTCVNTHPGEVVIYADLSRAHDCHLTPAALMPVDKRAETKKERRDGKAQSS